MKRWMYLCMSLMLVLTACSHRELSDPEMGHYLRIYLDENIKNVTCGFYDEELPHPEYKRPRVMRVVLADSKSGRMVSERFFQGQGEDERGYYIDGYIGAEAGTYNLLVYNFGSAVTHIRNEQDYFGMQAYTNPVNEYYLQYLSTLRQEVEDKDIVQEPEHLFHVVEEPLVIKKTNKIDTLKTASGDWFTAHSVVKSYYLQLRIKGIEWVTSVASLLSGMAGSTVLCKHNGMIEENPVNLFFTLNYKDKQTVRDGTGGTAVLYTTFSTFGKLPELPSDLTLNFEFQKTDGNSQVEKIDITQEFYKPLALNEQWILLDYEIVITKPEGGGTGGDNPDNPGGGGAGGGLMPGVEEWEKVESEIPL